MAMTLAATSQRVARAGREKSIASPSSRRRWPPVGALLVWRRCWRGAHRPGFLGSPGRSRQRQMALANQAYHALFFSPDYLAIKRVAVSHSSAPGNALFVENSLHHHPVTQFFKSLVDASVVPNRLLLRSSISLFIYYLESPPVESTSKLSFEYDSCLFFRSCETFGCPLKASGGISTSQRR